MYRKRLLAFALACLFLSAFTSAHVSRAPTPPPQDAGCDLSFAGSDRKEVKLRSPALARTFHNGGRAISVADWYALVCTFDPQVPTRRNRIPQRTELPQERLKVKVRGFLMAVKSEDDNDFHVQMGDTTRFRQQQLVVEIPPGADFCDARTELVRLMRADGARSLRRHIFRDPPRVDVTGYVFLDAAHMRARRTDFCTDNGGRGIKGSLRTSPVRVLCDPRRPSAT